MRDRRADRLEGLWRGGRITHGGIALVCCLLSACAARTVVLPPAVSTPRFPDYVFPNVPSDLQRADLARQQDLGWRWLQTGDLRNAKRIFAAVLTSSQGFYPAEAGLGYVELAGGNAEEALSRFTRAIRESATYPPALVGQGEALLLLKRDSQALASFQSALTLDASLELPRRRVEVLQLRLMQADLANASTAAAAGRAADAIAAYERAIAASPASAFLYRELGAVERNEGAMEAALQHYQKAVDLEPADPAAWREMGEILEGRQDYPAALQAYLEADAVESSPGTEESISRLRGLLALARMPPEYRSIPTSAALTRGELAALVGVRFERLLEGMPRRSAVVVTDTRGHWAATWIFSVSRAGVMDAFPNHTFQPEQIVRRGDLAQTVSRLLDMIGAQSPTLFGEWASARRPIADVGEDHLSYQAVSLAVAAGVLPLLDGDTFQLTRPVSGAEGLDAIERLEAMVPDSQRVP
jgi:tetratricopeptide (TPR) repeat protein